MVLAYLFLGVSTERITFHENKCQFQKREREREKESSDKDT